MEHLGTGTALELLGLLPDGQRSVILLRVLGELSVAETAEVIGRSDAAVKKLQAKALTTLRRLMSTEVADPGSTHEEVEQ